MVPQFRGIQSSPVSGRKPSLVVPVSAGTRGGECLRGTASGWTGAFGGRE